MTYEIGTKIKQLRTDSSLTQEELGARLHVSAQAVSKWENNTTMPDVQLLPELSVALGVSIDELFSLTDDKRMERIENQMEYARFMPDKDFEDAERFLREKAENKKEKARPRAVLLLAQLYCKRAAEYRDRAKPIAREALLLNPGEKVVHGAIFEAEGCPYSDWNTKNYWELIDFYKSFVADHPEHTRACMRLMDLLIANGRTAEARAYVEKMDAIEHSFRADLYRALIAKEECDLPAALGYWERMTEEFPDDWCAWASRADAMAQLCRYDEAMEFYQKAHEKQPKPRYVDAPEAMAQICEMRGDLAGAVKMREKCIELCVGEWNCTDGEGIEFHRREIARLQKLMRG